MADNDSSPCSSGRDEYSDPLEIAARDTSCKVMLLYIYPTSHVASEILHVQVMLPQDHKHVSNVLFIWTLSCDCLSNYCNISKGP